ncbi:polysaccharide biosynthesis protein [Halodesulfovibrio spirochaetisodalis]|uniref:Capsular biosynthesis protein n=1 Tax=Halodesulfovibrio spirochaetisodalis TaxID=1560234 RepID=A0A1B7XI36_9BACT|nr:nucleoside-diphosphate sugar epimerase/dehydratase [Halodesulfovibrio spirochaetisodalis]OBQ55173.1 capsular biosynthesis protein [Halodesulfovibrio spirochaetisodalis]
MWTLTRRQKQLVMLLADCLILPLSLWAAWSLRLGEPWPQDMMRFLWMYPFVIVVGVILNHRFGLYHSVVHYMGSRAIWAIASAGFLTTVALSVAAFLAGDNSFPRSVPFIFALLCIAIIGTSRMLVRSYYLWKTGHLTEKVPVVIYGAGEAGVQLLEALSRGDQYKPVAFLDDDRNFWQQKIYGKVVYPPEQLERLIKEKGVEKILLAIPEASRTKRQELLKTLADYPVHVLTVPSIEDQLSGRFSEGQLLEIELDDLLGREIVPPKPSLFEKNIAGKNVLVTGAGGSIGSELCRQILKSKPAVLVLYELSEYSLYAIDQELRKLISTAYNDDIVLVPILGNVCNNVRVEEVLAQYKINTIYHAAAYKHVPMVEHNIFEGIRNNILGTGVLANAALQHDVESFVLISTDKAVRPTNVMGATKRAAELILQALSIEASNTTFSMVRFGNVLGSSGSVVPLFRKQLASGGPLTVTHPEITRYFMSIAEASQLVIQAGAMAHGGDVFVLDMGEPVKITHLARQMIRFAGLTVREESSPNGDVGIEYVGLRPGEKLYEELLIDDTAYETEHPKILRASDEGQPLQVIQNFLHEFKVLEKNNDCVQMRANLAELVTGFTPAQDVVDYLNSKQ